jgi:hypothetical protein
VRALDGLGAARVVSHRLGAPLADLLDRVEADLKALAVHLERERDAP